MNNKSSNEKIRLFALIEPLNLKMSLCFPADTLVGKLILFIINPAEIHHFVDDIMRKYNVKYKVGRVDWNGAWILPQYRIGDFFEDKTEITIYSIEYGLTLTSLSSERDRLHVNHSVFYQDLNSNFLKKKLKRDKKKSLTTNVSRTTEFNDPNEIDDGPDDLVKADNNEDSNLKNLPTNVNNASNTTNGVKDVKDKPIQNKNVKDRQRPEGNKVEKQENLNKNKGKAENTQINTVNPKQNLNQQKSKQQQQQQQQLKQNKNYDSSGEENENDNEDRNDDRTNAKHKASIDSDTDSVDAQEDLKFTKKNTPHTIAKNR